MIRSAVLGLAAAVLAGPAAADAMPGPVRATVVSVYDGDTLTVDAHLWPGLTQRIAVRIDGLDTPEIRGRCAEEGALAVRAREALREIVGFGSRIAPIVELRDIRPDKYGSRVGARVAVNGTDVAGALIARGLARPYAGGKRGSWCAE